MDNVMIAYESLHTMKTRQKGGIGSMALKLDMSKAYDVIPYELCCSLNERIKRNYL